MSILKLTGSVGSGHAKRGLPHNDPDDFTKVKDRFVKLGYSLVDGTTNPKHKEFIKLIRLFQSIIKGRVRVDRGDGRIDLHGDTHRWLAAANSPGWVNMDKKFGWGWKVVDIDCGNSYATTWMENYLKLAGIQYYLTATLFKKKTAYVG